MYLEGTLRSYLNDLAAKKPAPGGGSAAALSAALGTGLMAMVARYTLDNPKYQSAASEMAMIASKSDEARAELESLVDADAEAYGKLSRVLKDEKASADAKERAYKEAVGVPFNICMIAAECLRLCEVLTDNGNRNLITDTAIAAIFLEGAFFSAKFNVYVNMKDIKDMDFIGKVHEKLAPLEEELPKLKEEILEKCEDVISR